MRRVRIEDVDQDTAEALGCDERFDGLPLVAITEYDDEGFGVRSFLAHLQDDREDTT